jgi:hypothetical protein
VVAVFADDDAAWAASGAGFDAGTGAGAEEAKKHRVRGCGRHDVGGDMGLRRRHRHRSKDRVAMIRRSRAIQ